MSPKSDPWVCNAVSPDSTLEGARLGISWGIRGKEARTRIPPRMMLTAPTLRSPLHSGSERDAWLR